ncbi:MULTISPECIES: Rv3235 family protein [unclassified Agrococcus]|uniref:Rv3235 family protein n=1 Tax=unclassified Agrococcus TaxID=2615065 RepID=UPI00361AE7F5
MSAVEADDYFDYQPCSTLDLPDPAPLVENLTRCVIEVLLGVRDVEQVARWVTEDTYLHLARRAIASRRTRTLRRQQATRIGFRIGPTVVTHPADGVVEATAIVRSPGRTRAVAMRLEGLDDRWRATALHVL